MDAVEDGLPRSFLMLRCASSAAISLNDFWSPFAAFDLLNDEMELTVLIPPFGSPYGLKVYTCPKCGRTEDYLTTAPSKAA
jgi:hypothetical protein